MSEKILVIKLSALGDFVQATAPFAAIRKHYPNAHITLFTTKFYAKFANKCPWFDVIITDSRPKWYEPKKWFKNAKLIKNYDKVFDLQTSSRSNHYYYLAKLLGFKGDWSGVAKGCSFPHKNPDRDFMHTIDRQREQLADAGINYIPKADISWLYSDISKFGIEGKYALIVPGGSPHRPQKRWSASNYAKLAEEFAKKDILPVVIGSKSEQEQIDLIIKECPKALSLMDKTTFEDIASLAKDSVLAVGNDTGPMHLIAAADTACLVLFSSDSDPRLCRPFGDVKIIQKDDLRDLSLEEVINFLNKNFSFS